MGVVAHCAFHQPLGSEPGGQNKRELPLRQYKKQVWARARHRIDTTRVYLTFSIPALAVRSHREACIPSQQPQFGLLRSTALRLSSGFHPLVSDVEREIGVELLIDYSGLLRKRWEEDVHAVIAVALA